MVNTQHSNIHFTVSVARSFGILDVFFKNFYINFFLFVNSVSSFTGYTGIKVSACPCEIWESISSLEGKHFLKINLNRKNVVLSQVKRGQICLSFWKELTI